MNIIPLLIFGGALLFTKKKKASAKVPAKEDAKKLPAESTRGTIFYGDNLPDIIKANVGETFSISFPPVPVGYTRKLAASPPDNSVEHVKTEYDLGAGLGAYNIVFLFRGAKKGSGSLVFHQQDARLEGKAPPSEIVEVLTEIL